MNIYHNDHCLGFETYLHRQLRNFLFDTNPRLTARLNVGQEVSSLSAANRFAGFAAERGGLKRARFSDFFQKTNLFLL